jgi:RNA-directed DNA polymerase
VVSNWVRDGREAVVHGRAWHRRVHHINYVRWADDFLVTANARQVVEDTIRPRLIALLAERGVRLSTEKTVMTPITDGCDVLGQTLRQHARRNGQPAKRQRTPSQGRFQGLKTKVKALGQQAVGATPARLIERLHPVWRGWAHDHRPMLCAETFATLDHFVWGRGYRWAKQRHPATTGRWITSRDCPPQAGESWRFTDPTNGLQIIRVQEAVTPQRHIKIKGDANPFDPQWEAYFQHHDRQRALRTTSVFRAKILHQQTGLCPICRQVIQSGEHLELHHRDGNHQNNQRANLVFLHPTCHRQVHYAPDSTPASTRPARGVGHA